MTPKRARSNDEEENPPKRRVTESEPSDSDVSDASDGLSDSEEKEEEVVSDIMVYSEVGDIIIEGVGYRLVQTSGGLYFTDSEDEWKYQCTHVIHDANRGVVYIVQDRASPRNASLLGIDVRDGSIVSHAGIPGGPPLHVFPNDTGKSNLIVFVASEFVSVFTPSGNDTDDDFDHVPVPKGWKVESADIDGQWVNLTLKSDEFKNVTLVHGLHYTNWENPACHAPLYIGDPCKYYFGQVCSYRWCFKRPANALEIEKGHNKWVEDRFVSQLKSEIESHDSNAKWKRRTVQVLDIVGTDNTSFYS